METKSIEEEKTENTVEEKTENIEEENKVKGIGFFFWLILIILFITFPFILTSVVQHFENSFFNWIKNTYTVSDLIDYWGSLFGGIGGLFLGYVIYKQNDRFQKDNSRLQKVLHNEAVQLQQMQHMDNMHQQMMTRIYNR